MQHRALYTKTNTRVITGNIPLTHYSLIRRILVLATLRETLKGVSFFGGIHSELPFSVPRLLHKQATTEAFVHCYTLGYRLGIASAKATQVY